MCEVNELCAIVHVHVIHNMDKYRILTEHRIVYELLPQATRSYVTSTQTSQRYPEPPYPSSSARSSLPVL